MSTTLTKITILMSGLASALPAGAATEGRDTTSAPIVWGFLGLCALIIIAQIIPMISNLRKQSQAAAEQSKSAKHLPL
ncbi:MAG: hypothetical protein M0023_16040 [Desulfobacteraceae bacterium]|nr:hypothetical protein [Desulfobacteraceae bacterium]